MSAPLPSQDVTIEVLRALREQIFEVRARSAVQERILVDLLARQIAVDPEAMRALLDDVRVNLVGSRDDVDPQYLDRILAHWRIVVGAADRRAVLLTSQTPAPPTGLLDRLKAFVGPRTKIVRRGSAPRHPDPR